MPFDFYQALITTGTLHIIALSGMNITILINLTAKATLFLGRRISIIVTICLIALFVMFVGAGPTIVRAAIMGSLSLIAIYFGRVYFSLLSLIMASLVMLLFDPDLIGNISFQLSFLATLGIIIGNRTFASQYIGGSLQRFILPIVENFRLTIFAQIFTLPVILYNFGRISLVSPLANVLIEWTIQPIMVLGFVTVALGLVWLPLANIAAYFTWVPLTYLIKTVEFLSVFPFASVQF